MSAWATPPTIAHNDGAVAEAKTSVFVDIGYSPLLHAPTKQRLGKAHPQRKLAIRILTL
jgi:hypothetical protein